MALRRTLQRSMKQPEIQPEVATLKIPARHWMEVTVAGLMSYYILYGK